MGSCRSARTSNKSSWPTFARIRRVQGRSQETEAVSCPRANWLLGSQPSPRSETGQLHVLNFVVHWGLSLRLSNCTILLSEPKQTQTVASPVKLQVWGGATAFFHFRRPRPWTDALLGHLL